MMTTDPDLLETIGQRLRSRRLQKRLTQADLAREAHVSPRFLVQLEAGRGNISIQRLAAVCEPLELSLEELFRGVGPGAQREKICLVGLRGAGKSTLGAALGQRMQLPFVELDDRVEERAGLSLAELFGAEGAGRYRELEAAVLAEVLAEPGPLILAAGGSVVTDLACWRRLRAQCCTIWLKASPASHLRRVTAQGDLRPMAGSPNALRELTEILASREPLYALAEHHIDTDALGEAGALAALVDRVQR